MLNEVQNMNRPHTGASPDLIRAELAQLREATILMARTMGTRMSREQVCDRLGVHRNTLATYVRQQRFPAPMPDGKWLLSEVMAWEARQITA